MRAAVVRGGRMAPKACHRCALLSLQANAGAGLQMQGQPRGRDGFSRCFRSHHEGWSQGSSQREEQQGWDGGTQHPKMNPSVLHGTQPQWGRGNVKAVRSWEVLGISLEGKEPHGAAFAGLSANFPLHRRGPGGPQPQETPPSAIKPR